MSQRDQCPSGTNVLVGQMSSGTNVSGTTVNGTNVCGTNVTPPRCVEGTVIYLRSRGLSCASSRPLRPQWLTPTIWISGRAKRPCCNANSFIHMQINSDATASGILYKICQIKTKLLNFKHQGLLEIFPGVTKAWFSAFSWGKAGTIILS